MLLQSNRLQQQLTSVSCCQPYSNVSYRYSVTSKFCVTRANRLQPLPFVSYFASPRPHTSTSICRALYHATCVVERAPCVDVLSDVFATWKNEAVSKYVFSWCYCSALCYCVYYYYYYFIIIIITRNVDLMILFSILFFDSTQNNGYTVVSDDAPEISARHAKLSDDVWKLYVCSALKFCLQ